MRFDKLAEYQIRKAKSEGQLDGLKGEGEPLKLVPSGTDAAEAAGFRLMADAGVLPREMELKKAADALREQIAATQNAELRKVLMAELGQIEMRRAIEAEARRKYMKQS
jgi:hypothetical protein